MIFCYSMGFMLVVLSEYLHTYSLQSDPIFTISLNLQPVRFSDTHRYNWFMVFNLQLMNYITLIIILYFMISFCVLLCITNIYLYN